jgi:LytS/YehU family sensor histidine kinase
VSPGTYVFHVKGSNSDGVWNSEGISVVIIISPAWWATWWFRILAAVILISGTWYIIYARLRTIRKRHEDEKKILEIEKQMFSLEQTALRLQINPHFIFNSLNSIQSFIIANDTDRAINYLAKFAQLMRLILSNSHQTFVPISDEIKAISYYLDIERLRFNNKFDYQIIIDPKIDTDFMDIPPMIIQPYIENAILHGILHKKDNGNIRIEVKLAGNSLQCVVEDDGIGRERSMEIKAKSDLYHKSRGMLITQKRLDLLNKQNKEQMSVEIIDLKDDSGNARGTRVNIFITYQENV